MTTNLILADDNSATRSALAFILSRRLGLSVAGEAAKGIAQASLATGVPVVFGVLTTDTIEQAIDRAGTKMGNKGGEAATTAIEMVNLLRALEA